MPKTIFSSLSDKAHRRQPQGNRATSHRTNGTTHESAPTGVFSLRPPCLPVTLGLIPAALLLTLPLPASAIGQTTLVSVAPDGTPASGHNSSGASSISANGRYIAFQSDAANLVPDDTNDARDVFVRDLLTGQTTRVSMASDGTQSNNFSAGTAISADGRYVVFGSDATNLVPGGRGGLFIHDWISGETTQVDVAWDGRPVHYLSFNASISADGRYVAFDSFANNLTPEDDSNSEFDVFVRDRQTGQTTRVSVASDGTQGQGYYGSTLPVMSADGRYIAFQSDADNLVHGDVNKQDDVFVHDLQTHQTTLVSVATDGTGGDDRSESPAISADGRYIAFSSHASNLVPGDTNGTSDVFVHDRHTGETARVSVNSEGEQAEGYEGSFTPAISADGRHVAFSSRATNLVPEDTNAASDIFVHDRETKRTQRVSVAADGTQGSEGGFAPSISADGRYVTFGSSAGNMVAGDTNGTNDVFVHDRLLMTSRNADLAVTQSKSADLIRQGDPLAYTITVRNNSFSPALYVNLSDLIPSNTQLLSVMPSQGSCYPAPVMVCHLGNLAGREKATIQVNLQADQAGMVYNTVTVNAAPEDNELFNNSSAIRTKVAQ